MGRRLDLTFGHGGQTIRFGPLLDALQEHQAIVLLRWEDLVQRRAVRDDTLFWWKFASAVLERIQWSLL